MKAAATRPPTRETSSGPRPIPSRWSSDAGVVMLFHSPMSRMNSTLPGCGGRRQGAEDRQLAQVPRHHGHREQRHGAQGGRERDAGRAGRRAPGRHPRAQPIPEEGGAQDRKHQHAVVSGEGGQPRQQARQGKRPRPSLQAAPGQEQGARDQRLVEREVVRLGHVDEGQRRQRRQDPGADSHEGRGAGIPRDQPGQGCGDRADERERQGGRERRRPQQPDERHLDQGRQGHPVRVGGDRQHRVRRDPAADLREDPDDVDREALPRRQPPGDVHVVERIRVRGVREPRGDHEPRHQREQVQGDRDLHGRCSLAPGPGPPEGYELATGYRPTMDLPSPAFGSESAASRITAA